MSEITASVDLSGPFFQRDPGKTLRANIEQMMEALAQEGAGAARRGFADDAGSRRPVAELGDRVADHVIGRTAARDGRKWRASAVVQVYNQGLNARESESLMAAASYLEGRRHIIRTIGRQIGRSRAVLSANLTKGLE